MNETKFMSKVAAKWYASRQETSVIKSETFNKLQNCPDCHQGPSLPIGNIPTSKELVNCVFCDCQADVKVGRWMDAYKRFDAQLEGWAEVVLCDNRLTTYSTKEGYAKIGGILTDSGVI
jgi:hypothetical protein